MGWKTGVALLALLAGCTGADDTGTDDTGDTGDTDTADSDTADSDTADSDTADSGDTGLDTSDTGLDTSDTGLDTGEPQECAAFVWLDDRGRFRLGRAPFAPVGTNFHLAVGARVTNADQPDLDPEDYEWELFLAPSANYLPTNNGICRDAWADAALCCDDEVGCHEMLVEEHVDRLVALGINSVRLVGIGIDYDAAGNPYAPCDRLRDAYSAADYADGWACRIDLTVPAYRERVIDLMREAVDLLGEHGIRTILLPGSHGHEDHPAARQDYLDALGEVAAEFENDPYLLAYDPMNEPPYAYGYNGADPYIQGVCPDGPPCKALTAKISADWYDAIAAEDPGHLVSIGLANTQHSAGSWDPQVLSDHFSSWHIYPPSPWTPEEGLHGSRYISQEIYHLAQTTCGNPCPFVGAYDGARCLVAVGPVGADDPFLWETGMYYPYQAGAEPCPVGEDDGANCHVGTFLPGRDAAVIERQPFFYLAPAVDGVCPANTTWDGANCGVGEGPVGAQGSIRGSNPAGYYYEWLDGPSHCVTPAVDDGVRCRWGDVPAGGTPFISYRPWYFVDPVTCGPKKPAMFGETGFASYPDGFGYDPAWYAQGDPRRLSKYQECVDGNGDPEPDAPVHGDDAEQQDFLFGGSYRGWRGLYGTSHACGMQGLHWWVFASVNWGICREDNFGLYNYWYLTEDVAPDGDDLAMVTRPVADRFDDIDYLSTVEAACYEPGDFHDNLAPGPLPFLVTGTVVDEDAAPIPNAMVFAWSADWSRYMTAYSDWKGVFTLAMPDCPPRVGATTWGRTRVETWNSDCQSPATMGTFTLAPEPSVIDPLPLPPPNQWGCRAPGGPWVPGSSPEQQEPAMESERRRRGVRATESAIGGAQCASVCWCSCRRVRW